MMVRRGPTLSPKRLVHVLRPGMLPLRRRLALVVLLLFLGGGSVAAQPETGEGPTVGIGVTLPPTAIGPVLSSDRDFPIGFTAPVTFSIVRLEPQVGYVRVERSEGGGSRSTSVLTLGVGSFYLVRFDRTLLLTGVRIGFARTVTTAQPAATPSPAADPPPRKTVDFFLGPALGGEHYVSDHFSVGAEVRLLYVNTDSNRPTVPSITSLQTGGAAFLRFHF